MMFKFRQYQAAVEQVNGREGETATFLFGLSVFPTLRGGGFAPRHLNRYAASVLRPLLLLSVLLIFVTVTPFAQSRRPSAIS